MAQVVKCDYVVGLKEIYLFLVGYYSYDRIYGWFLLLLKYTHIEFFSFPAKCIVLILQLFRPILTVIL